MEAEESSILQLASSVIDSLKDPLPSQVLGEGIICTAIESAIPTSPGQTYPDATAVRGSNIGADQQPTGNDPDITGEPKGKYSHQYLRELKV